MLMLCIVPFSLNVNGKVLRYIDVVVEVKTSVLPRIFVTGWLAVAYVQYIEYILFATADDPNVAGIPLAHVDVVLCALPGVPVLYLVLTLLSNIHDSQIVCPFITDTGLVSINSCHPSVAFTAIVDDSPSLVPGLPEASL